MIAAFSTPFGVSVLPVVLASLILSTLSSPASSGPPADPLTSADPFNPENDFTWTNNRQPPPRNAFGRFVYLPSRKTPSYTSLFSISGRPCSFMYVNTSEDLPQEGRRIRLSVDTSLVFAVIQVSLVGDAFSAEDLDVRRIYAYICSDDGQWHPLSHGGGQWTYDVLRPAEVGLPEYVDGGILAAPRFYKVPTNASESVPRRPCEDRADWRALDGQWSCADYRQGEGGNSRACTDTGYIDPSLVNPGSAAMQIRWGMPAYEACPRACGNCFDCHPNITLADPIAVAAVRAEGRVENGCALGFACPRVEGGQGMVKGEVVGASAFPLLVSGELRRVFRELLYTCAPADLSGQPQTSAPNHEELEFEEGVTNEGFLVVRVVAPSAGSVVRYTIDGSDPTFDHGTALPSGGVITLKRSGQIRARAVRVSAQGVTVRESRIAELPFLQVQMAAPAFRVLQVGHYVKASAHGLEQCAPGGGFATSEAAGDYRRIRSNGCPSFEAGAGEGAGRAVHQAWEVRVPLDPVLAREPLAVLGAGGVVGVARDGVPILAPPASESEHGFAVEEGLRDACGGLALSVEVEEVGGGGECPGDGCVVTTLHHGQYHYRGLPQCLAAATAAEGDGHAGLLGFMLDGVPLYGVNDRGGAPPTDLDQCGGHRDPGRPWYHYHAREGFPGTVGCLRGCLDPTTSVAVNAGLAAAQGPCVPGKESSDQSPLHNAEWVLPAAASERERLMEGRFGGSVSVEMQCPQVEEGLAELRYTVDGSTPTPGGGPGQGYGRGAATVVVAENTTLRAMCEAFGTVASPVAESPRLVVEEIAYNPNWQATAGYWNLSDAGALFGELFRERQRLQGLCSESYDTRVAPAYLADSSSSGIGALLLSPPDCKTDSARWSAAQQPDLAELQVSRWGVRGVLFDGEAAEQGLEAVESVTELAERGVLPEEAMSVEVWATMEGSEAGEGVLVGVAMRAPGFLGKGWYLGYEVEGGGALVTLKLSVATEGSDNFGRGGLVSVRATLPAAEIGGYWAHVAGSYDGRDLRVWLNGSLVGEERACRAERCGRVVYPVRDGLYVAEDVHFGVGGLDLVGQRLEHRGVIGHVRVLRTALSEAQLAAGARRMEVGLQLLRCPLGSFGAYDGLEPCEPCPGGSAARLRGLSECEPCAVGSYAEGPGARECTLCAGGELTPGSGARGPEECTGPDYCQTVLHDCHRLAACAPTEGSFTCECMTGFEGDGVECEHVCGDGLRVEGEECDDGNRLSSDGCDSACRLEQGFECEEGGGGAGGGDECRCVLGATACCIREYSSCLARSPECAEECFANLTSCLQQSEHLERTAEMAVEEYLAVPLWEGDEGAAGCRLVARKGCALSYRECKQSEAAAAGAEPESCAGAGGSCVAAYGACIGRTEVTCRER